MSQQPRLDVVTGQLSAEKRVVLQVDLPDSQVVARTPPRVDGDEVLPTVRPRLSRRDGCVGGGCRGGHGVLQGRDILRATTPSNKVSPMTAPDGHRPKVLIGFAGSVWGMFGGFRDEMVDVGEVRLRVRIGGQ